MEIWNEFPSYGFNTSPFDSIEKMAYFVSEWYNIEVSFLTHRKKLLSLQKGTFPISQGPSSGP